MILLVELFFFELLGGKFGILINFVDQVNILEGSLVQSLQVILLGHVTISHSIDLGNLIIGQALIGTLSEEFSDLFHIVLDFLGGIHHDLSFGYLELEKISESLIQHLFEASKNVSLIFGLIFVELS